VVEEPVIEDLEEAKKVEEHAAEIEVAPVVVGSRVEVSATSIAFKMHFSEALSRYHRRNKLRTLPSMSRMSRQSPRWIHCHSRWMGTVTRTRSQLGRKP
jgi:hypothetical protein